MATTITMTTRVAETLTRIGTRSTEQPTSPETQCDKQSPARIARVPRLVPLCRCWLMRLMLEIQSSTRLHACGRTPRNALRLRCEEVVSGNREWGVACPLVSTAVGAVLRDVSFWH